MKCQYFEETQIGEDCLWSDWETWGNCSKPCGGGEQNRYRFVVRDPLGEGRNCTGRPQDSRGCNEDRRNELLARWQRN